MLSLNLSLRISDCCFCVCISNLAFSNGTTEKPKAYFFSFSTVLAAPILSVHSPSCDSIAVSWTAVHMAAGFSVSLMRSDGLGRMLKQNTTNTSLIFTNLDPGTLYTIKAYAWNANGMPGDDFTYNQRTSKKFSFLKPNQHSKNNTACVYVWLYYVFQRHIEKIFRSYYFCPISKFMKAQMTWLCLVNITDTKIPFTVTKVVPKTGLGRGYTSSDWFWGFF